MEKKIAVILGDGIGPEVTQQSIKVLDTIAKHYGVPVVLHTDHAAKKWLSWISATIF